MTDKEFAVYMKSFHTGRRRSISSKQLELKFGVKSSQSRKVVNRFRIGGTPICSYEYGYFYAETQAELEETVLQLRSRMKKIGAAEQGLSKTLYQKTTY